MLSVKSIGLLSQPIVGAMLLVSIITALPPASFAQQKPAVVSGQLDTNYTLGGGDRIKISVFEVPDYTGEYQIPPGGILNLPLIRKVSLLGLTTEEAADLIEKKYERFLKRPIISVNLLSPRPINIFVAGEVTRPGSYSLSLQGGAGQDPGVQYPTILSALTTAQGTTLSADVSQVEVFRKLGRGGEQRVVLNLRELIRTGQTTQDITLRDGDRIVVNRATSINLADVRNLSAASFSADISRPRTVAIIGEVNRPGSYLVTTGTTEANTPGQTGGAGVAGLPTISKAIQQAGGITPQADLRNVTIRRLTRTGDPQSLTVNLMQLLQGDIDQDQILQDGDTIFIATGTEINRAEATQLATTTLSPSKIQVGVVGEVKRPGPVDIVPNSSLNQALLAAGGFNDARASRSAVDLVRLNPDGSVTKRVVKIDLASGINEQTNPILRNNDVIIVSRNGITKGGDTAGSIINPLGGLLGIFRALFGL